MRRARGELLVALRDCYSASSKADKGRTLDGFVALTGHNRNYAARLLNLPAGTASGGGGKIASRRIYGQAVRDALVVLWEASDRICSKRLRAILPTLIHSLEAHGHLQLDRVLKDRLRAISPASTDRVLAPVRRPAAARSAPATGRAGRS